jgi:DNA polymerase III epsilon subunit family exonuclease
MELDPDVSSFEIPFVVFDFETTGLKADDEEIIEIGAVKIKGGEEIAEYSVLVNPLKAIPSQASAVNKIYDKDVANAPTLVEVLPAFLRFISGSVLVAHNANFDCRFLSAAIRKLKIADLDNYVMDTLLLSRKLHSQHGSHRLAAICQRLKIDNVDAHRAVHDARATAKVLKYFLEELTENGSRTFRQVAHFHGTPLERVKGAKGGMPVKAYLEMTSSSLF